MKNALSIDLESWVHYRNDILRIPFDLYDADRGKKEDGGHLPRAVNELLALLRRYGQKLTFFVVSELYEWYPEAIERIAEEGHEISWHTHTHRRITGLHHLNEERELASTFFDRFLPSGFRAPQLYLPPGLHELLGTYGIRYSSSSYDIDEGREFAGVRELPVSSLQVSSGAIPFPKHLKIRLLLRRFPWGSGLIFPLAGSCAVSMIRYWNRKGRSANVFVHPWQLYKPAALTNAGFRLNAMLKNPLGLPYQCTVLHQFEKILSAYRFVTIDELLGYAGSQTR